MVDTIFKEFVVSLHAYADICKILKTVGASDVRSYLEEHDLTKLFPLLDKFVKNEILPKMSRSPLTSHLSSFSTYGQACYDALTFIFLIDISVNYVP